MKSEKILVCSAWKKRKPRKSLISLLLLKGEEHAARLFLISAEQSADRESRTISILGYF